MLYLTRLDQGRLAGLIFDGGWLATDELEWDPSRTALRFVAGGRARQAQIDGDRLVLDGLALGRRWQEGVWLAEGKSAPFGALLTGLGRWDVPGSAERWLAKTYDGKQWLACARCELTSRGVLVDGLHLELDPPRLQPNDPHWSLVRLPDHVVSGGHRPPS
jgi:hypothetical protein